MLLKLIKYDMKELFKKHIGIYAVIFVTAICGMLFMLWGRYFPRNQIVVFLYPFMELIYVVACIVLFVISFIFMILHFRKNLLKDEGYLMHTLPVKEWMLYVSKLISGYLIYLINIAVVVVSVFINTLEVKKFFDLLKELDGSLNVIGYDGSFMAFMTLILLFGGLFTITMFYFCMCVGYLANGNRDAFSIVALILVYIVNQFVNAIMLMFVPIKDVSTNSNINIFKAAIIGMDVTPTFENLKIIVASSMGINIVMMAGFIAVSIFVLTKKLNLE